MLSSKDIREVKFSRSMGGYKQEEVDILLDKIEADYDQYERNLRELQEQIGTLNKEIETYKSSQGSIQNVLISAQQLADRIVEEAKQKSEQVVSNAETSIELITAREKELSAAFERKAEERRAQAEKEFTAAVEVVEAKKRSLESAANDSVKRQQMLFDKLKLEISAFKSDITKKYKEHLELLQKLPDEVPMDPKRIAEAVAAVIERAPDPERYVELPANGEPEQEKEPELPEETGSSEVMGFVVDAGDEDDEYKEDDE